MQSEPPEVSPDNSLANSLNSSTANQHGLPDEHEQSSATLLRREDVARISRIAVDSDAASVSSEESRRGREAHSGRLTSSSSSSSSRSSQRGSPVNRIDEYERQQTYSRRRLDRITFQVVPSTRSNVRGISIQEFPNGRASLWSYIFRFC